MAVAERCGLRRMTLAIVFAVLLVPAPQALAQAPDPAPGGNASQPDPPPQAPAPSAPAPTVGSSAVPVWGSRSSQAHRGPPPTRAAIRSSAGLCSAAACKISDRAIPVVTSAWPQSPTTEPAAPSTPIGRGRR